MLIRGKAQQRDLMIVGGSGGAGGASWTCVTAMKGQEGGEGTQPRDGVEGRQSRKRGQANQLFRGDCHEPPLKGWSIAILSTGMDMPGEATGLTRG